MEDQIELGQDEEMEVAPEVIKAAPAAPQLNEKIHFDEWFSSRKHRIPPQHMKEILMADFKARKVPMEAGPNVFDKALEVYGVKLG